MTTIAVMGGDGTGPEVVAQSVKVLNAVGQKFGLAFRFDAFDCGAGRYLKTGKLLEDSEIATLKTYDAILFGAIGDPQIKPGVLEKGILLKLRFALDQYINLRPVKLYPNVNSPIKNVTPADIDYVVVRENSGDVYTGAGGVSMKNTPHEVAVQEMIYSRHQVERCIRYAFETVRKRHRDQVWRGLSDGDRKMGFRGQLTLCGKTNVLTYVYDLWERVFHEVGSEYSDVKRDYVHVDAACIYMIENPARFDVIVTTNMFGDIITDLAAVTQGGMGVAPGGNINPEGVSMFEPIGGTAPTFTGQNAINPLASIGSAAMMLAHLGFDDAATDIENAISQTTQEMTSMAAGKMGMTTTQVGDRVVFHVQH
jgi:3-isopropylmalate dehydrogenase